MAIAVVDICLLDTLTTPSIQLEERDIQTMNGQSSTRVNTFHGPKRQLLGNQAGYAPPAWRTGAVPIQDASGKGKNARLVQEPGSKIFLSRLPVDVEEKEVEVSMRLFMRLVIESRINTAFHGRSCSGKLSGH